MMPLRGGRSLGYLVSRGSALDTDDNQVQNPAVLPPPDVAGPVLVRAGLLMVEKVQPICNINQNVARAVPLGLLSLIRRRCFGVPAGVPSILQ
jgi:hypothetical protein